MFFLFYLVFFYFILGTYFGYLVIGGITVALLFGRKNLNAEEDQNDQKGKTIFFLDLFSQSFLSQKC